MTIVRRVTLAVFCLCLLAACSRTGGTVRGTHNAWTQPGIVRLGEPDEPDSLNAMFGHTYAT
ncbi:MAG TPA: hypothetical protein VFA29_00770, partial [Candidatus Baltobacteraceae bacterium]|nr:hypothetical protein [Candidatus Baltobacteraceae bacterium]